MSATRIKRSNTPGAVPASLSDGEIAINQSSGVLYYHTSAGGVGSISASSSTSYTLPVATSTVLGGVKVGSGLSIDNGVLSANPAEDTVLRSYFLPAAPSNLVAAPGDQSVSLSWTAPVALSPIPVIDYVVQYSSDNATWSTFSHSASPSTAAVVSGLTNDVQYWLRVAAVNAFGQGAWSSTSTASAGARVSVDYLMVAGGGGGGSYRGGGGGAGGYLYATLAQRAGVALTVTVGAGGAGGAEGSVGSARGRRGNDSVLVGDAATITANGGGYGACGLAWLIQGSPDDGGAGGSGGGGSGYPAVGNGGSGTLNQGYRGGPGNGAGEPFNGGGGGGAASMGQGGANYNNYGGAGQTAQSEILIATSSGRVVDASITPVYAVAGGGGCGTYNLNSAGTPGEGGSGGGGSGGRSNEQGVAGYSNTGSGGGGGGNAATGGAGGSGLVILRVADTVTAATTTGSPSVYVSGGYRYYKFTGSGSITF